MKAIDIGTVCIKTTGREAGKKAVVIKLVDENFAMVDGKSVRRRKCNLTHLFPTGEKLEIKENEEHAHIVKLLK